MATLSAPTVLGEMGMWRHRPSSATVLSRLPNRIEVLVVDAERFESLRHEPGFRVATAAAVQQRLAANAAVVGTALADAAAKTGDRRLASIAQLVQYLSGDFTVPLDAVIGLPIEATPIECVEALRHQVAEAVEAGGLDPALERSLAQVLATVG